MERALLREIGELERSIGELTRRKARRAGVMTSPEWQTPAVQLSRRPDGFSGRQENPQSVSHDGTPAKPTMQLKLPRFNGTASLESYLAQLELAAQLGGWTPEQTAGHLALALEGPALEAILDLPPAERQNLQALTAALQRRFIQHRSAEASREKLLSRYCCEEESWAYPEFNAAAQEKLALHAFLRALTPERLRDHVSLAQPGSISEALIKTTRAEDTLAIRPTPQPARQHVRVADGEEVHWTRTPLPRPARRQGRCYRCDEPGHIARDCPAPAPKPREPPPSGNEAGTAHPALPAPVAKIPATSAEASTSAFEKATEHKSHPGEYSTTPAGPNFHHRTADIRDGAKMAMRGKKEVKVTVSRQEVSHEFWLADIADSCIIGLDLLKRWGACVDVSRASITLGAETVALQSVPQPDHSLAHHHQPATQQPPDQPKPALPAETTAAVHAPWQRRSSRLDHQQRQQLKSLLDGNTDLLAVRDEDCTQTELVQHTINTDTAQPIRLRPHRMSPAKRLVAEEKEGQSMAFDQLRAALTEAPVLAYPDAQRPFIVDTNASNNGVGAVLSQEDEDGERAVAYYSRALGKAERNYCVTRRELLAVVRALHHFRPYLQGSHFLLRTDHASLTWLLNCKDPEGQVARWLEQLQGYDFEIRHRAGRLHGNADALSRRPCAAQECRYCRRQEERDQVSPDVAVVQARCGGWLARWARLVHGSVGAGHFGNNKTLHRLRGKFHWPGCRHDVELHVHCCDSCTAQKGPNQRSRAPLQQHLVGAPMERVGVDVLWPFPITDSGNCYILVAMDYFTKWPEAFAVPDQSAATTAERLVEEMFTRFGAPAELHSDQERNFESQVLAEVCKRLGVTKTRTTPLHPQSDGLVERFNRTLATQLAIFASQHQCDWDRHLPLVLWAYRSAMQESSQLTPGALMFGRELRTPVDLVFGAPPEPEEPSRTREYYHRLRDRLLVAHDFTRKAQASAGFKQKRCYDTRCRGRAFAVGEQVWVYCPERKKGLSPKLRASWRGPGEVVERLSEVVYRIRMPGRGHLVVLHQDRLAPYRPLATPESAEPEVSSDTALPSEPEPSDTPLSATGRPKRHRRPPGHLRDFEVSCCGLRGRRGLVTRWVGAMWRPGG
ncbi:hypothetical protein SKAU_G00092560 [Synaphobranchus kaupii]|uniref:Gypsy retrotransposon integrase-like protein 1 n=1 Tax=Synaphobranchus kaupii TaxID=118154 RepID=A0A9Q1J6M7_SYNKA|nr:hypothetical protein SKAU_G00092560 [Synaphobranchus kaupii]